MKNLNKYIVIVIIAFSGIFTINNAQGQQELSLETAILKGLENNFQVLIFEEYYKSAQLNNSWGTVGRYPSITLGVNSINRFDNTPSVQNPDDRSDLYTNRLSPYVNVNWILFNGFSVKMNKEKLDLLERYSAGNSALVVENTVQSIILGYYLALLEQERLKVLAEVKDLSGDRYEYEMIRKDIGSAVTFEVLQAKNSFLSDSTNYLLQKLNVRNAFLRLNLLLGEPPEVSFILVDSFQTETYTYNLDDLEQKMMSSNKTLQNQYVNQEILKKGTGIAKSASYPSLMLNAGTDYNKGYYDLPKDNNYDSHSFDYYANFTLSFNLFNGGNTRSAIQQAGISEHIGLLETLEIKQTLANLLVNQYELYDIRKQLLNVANSNMESAELNMQIATDKYRNGTINSFNFRDVQLIYLNAAHRKLNAIYDIIDTHTELLRLTGGIVTEN
ncbi:MAG: TolC family protein [Bacteroidetes bacterium]|nr:TolC family protein [Bacteroidota bacterium]